MPTADYAKYTKAKQQTYDASHNTTHYRPSWAYTTITSAAKSTTQANSTIPSIPTPCPTPSPSTDRSTQATGSNPFADFWGKIRDIPSNIEYSCSSPDRFFSALLGGGVRTISTVVLMPVAFGMDYTVFLGNTMQNNLRGEENCPIGTCESAVAQLTDNIEEWCVNDCGGDRRAYEGGESNADVLTTSIAIYYGVRGIASIAESASAWGDARSVARSASTAVEAVEDIVYSPINPGTLLSDDVVSTFRNSTYTEKVLTEDTVFYRVYGGNAEMAGNYMSRTPQMGGLQSQLDLALVPEWGNTATYVTEVTVPKGTIIYEGFAAPQTINGGAGMLMGGGSQIYIPEARFNSSWFGN